MPAVTVDNPLELPKVVTPLAGQRARSVKVVTTAPKGLEGEGFPVRRAFAGIDQADLDPFVHMDQMGEVDYGPGEPKGTPWHPHRGFETVTYMMEGTFLHQDSIGGGGVIENGATQWMTAGAGILHIERPPDALIDSGGLFHGIQLWVNLPAKLKAPTKKEGDCADEEMQARKMKKAELLATLSARPSRFAASRYRIAARPTLRHAGRRADGARFAWPASRHRSCTAKESFRQTWRCCWVVAPSRRPVPGRAEY